MAKAEPDGYTLLAAGMGVAVNAVLYPKLPYDTLRDLAPITMLAAQPNIVVVHPSLPVKSVRELVALAKARPGQVSYASGGVSLRLDARRLHHRVPLGNLGLELLRTIRAGPGFLPESLYRAG